MPKSPSAPTASPSGLQKLGVKQGDSVCMLMRNDIAFIEAAYAAMRLGAYGVPVNWHFKPEEINYVLKDSGTSVLIAHADMLHQLRDAIPDRRHRAQRADAAGDSRQLQDRSRSSRYAGFRDRFRILARAAKRATTARCVPQPQNMIYTSGTTGHPKGVRRFAPTPEQSANAERCARMIYGLKPGARALLPGPLYHSAPNSFGLRAGRLGGALVLMPRFEPEEFLRLDRDAADRHHLHGADHVHPADEAAGRVAQEIRHVLAAPHHPCRRALPGRRQARDDRMVGAGDLRILRLDRIRRGHLRQFRGCAEEARHRRQDIARRGTALHRRGRKRDCRRARSARSIRASPAIRISPITTSRRNAPRSTATVSSPRATSAISMRTAMSSSATASATW